MPRRTKIVATLGPATDDENVIDEMIHAGMDVVRVNFSHGTHEDHVSRAENVLTGRVRMVTRWVCWQICRVRRSALNVSGRG